MLDQYNTLALTTLESAGSKFRIVRCSDSGLQKLARTFALSEVQERRPESQTGELCAVEEYRDQFARRAHEMLTGRGPLSVEASTARLRRRIIELENAVVAESARWGRSGPPYKKSHWDAAVKELIEIIAKRNDIVLTQLQNAKRYARGLPGDPLVNAALYPAISPPRLNPPGGWYEKSHIVSIMGAEGEIYFTTDGSDPRLPDGSINPAGSKASDRSMTRIALTEPFTTVKARRHIENRWSFLTTENYRCGAKPADGSNVMVSEIMYHPAPPSAAEIAAGFAKAGAFEFIEVLNTGAVPVDLAHSAFVLGSRITFPDHSRSILDPGARAVIAKDSRALRLRYGAELEVLGEFHGNLSDGGETVQFIDASGRDICRFVYNDTEPWPAESDGRGKSLVLVNPNADETGNSNLSKPERWKASNSMWGSPGRPDSD